MNKANSKGILTAVPGFDGPIMKSQKANPTALARIAEDVRAFYDTHPYPTPVEDLDDYRRRWQDDDRRRADYHLHWPTWP